MVRGLEDNILSALDRELKCLKDASYGRDVQRPGRRGAASGCAASKVLDPAWLVLRTQ